MNPESIVAYLSLAGTSFGAFVWVVRKIRKIIARVAEIYHAACKAQDEVDTLWRFHMTRGHAETIIAGLGEEATACDLTAGVTDDPYRLILGERTKAAFAPIAAELRNLYTVASAVHSRMEIEQMIERQYRDWLVHNICIPLRVHEGGCLAMAFEVARTSV